MASVEELKARSKAQIDGSFSFRSWLHAAQKTRNLAQEADSKGDLENAYVGYRKTVNLIRAMLDHPEYKQHVSHKNSPEYYSYMDLKSKLLPTTSRMQELERTLTQRQGDEHHSGNASEPVQLNGDHSSSHHTHDTVETFNSLSLNVTPNSTGGSAASTSRPQPNGIGSRGSPSAARSTPPPVPSASTKPPVPPATSKSAFSSASGMQQPLTPTSPPTPSTHHGWAGMSAASHRVSNKLKERMAALHNAGMRDVTEYKTDDHERSPSLPFSHDGGKPALAPKPAVAAHNDGLRRSPAIHYGTNGTANTHASSSLASTSYNSTNGVDDNSVASTVPSNYSQDNSMPDPWPPKALLPKPSTDSMRTRMSSPHASSLDEGQDRPGSAPPASTGPPDASGPATTNDDWLTQSYESATDSYLSQDEHSSPALQSAVDTDSFTHRFPDVEQGDPLPSNLEPNQIYKTRQGGITQPFLPAPTSQSTLHYEGRNVRSGRSDTQSTVQSHSTGESAANLHRISNGYHSQMTPKPVMLGSQLAKPPRPLPKPPSLPSLPNRSTTTIEPQELWKFLETSDSPGQPSILLIDVRTRKEFSGGHIKGKTVCIEPFTLSSNSSAFSIENSLIVSPEAERRWFSERASFDLIVMYDKHSKSMSSRDSASYNTPAHRNSPVTFRSIADQAEDSVVNARLLSTLSSAIYELNFSDEHKRLKRSPLLLVGGYEAWIREIGDKGIQKETYTQPQYHSYHPHHAAKPHESHSMPPLHPARPAEAQHSKVESEYQAMLANRAQAESTLAAKTHTDGSEASADTKRQHRKAVLSGDGILSPAPLHNLQMPGPPPPAYSGAPAGPVAVHRTGPASPYEAYPSSSFQAMPFSQGPARAEYFEGYSSSQKNNFPAAPSGAPYHHQYPGRAIEYPTLQQKQQFGTGAVQRPSPTMSLEHASSLQKPAPTLARANSSSLHLYQTGDYLNAPAFGEFPKRLMALGDGVVGLTGLKNLGNTCYMNSMIQCLSATIPLARFFKEGSYKAAINRDNPLGTKGVLADAVAQLIRSLWSEQYRFLAPVTFREAICRFAPQFKGSDQHDSQEFLAFLLDGLHEDLNLVRNKPPPIEFTPEREKELETLPTQIAAEREWNIYLRRDDSIIVRLLQGQYKSQLRCMTCGTTSTTYNTFMYLSLPIPAGRNIREVTLAQCIDFFTQPETLDGDDAWNCSKCKVPRRATKALTISRLPPILLIHLKRFSFQGPFTDKIDTSVSFPVRGLDMSRHLPQPLSPHIKAKYEHAVGHTLNEPASQVYDLHAVSNHFGNLSSGHYTAFVRNRGQWHELNDSKVGRLTEAQVASAGKSAYTLWYSRRQT